jgi:hypothetical protein
MSVYQNPSPITKITITSRDNVRLFEVLGQGQQFVGYGQPVEGIWYEWLGQQHPFVTPINELTSATPEQLYLLEDVIRYALSELGYNLKDKRTQPEETPKPNRTYDNEDENITELCRAALPVVPNDLDRDEWVEMCYAMHSAGLDYSDWEAFCYRWSGQHKPGVIVQTWNSWVILALPVIALSYGAPI